MQYPIQTLLLVVAFITPNSPAVISGNITPSTEAIGYHCSLGTSINEVNIHYGGNAKQLPCQVTLFSYPSKDVVQLLEAKRNVATCENKAELMATRFRDRGWHCERSGF